MCLNWVILCFRREKVPYNISENGVETLRLTVMLVFNFKDVQYAIWLAMVRISLKNKIRHSLIRKMTGVISNSLLSKRFAGIE